MKRWVRDFFVLPLLVGLIIALASYFLPKLFSAEKEISYTVERPVQYLEDPALDKVSVEVNGQRVNSIYAHRIRIWNSGDIPIKDIPIRFVYSASDTSNKILTLSHSTTPKFEFGRINKLEEGPNFKRFNYELLNPGDEDLVTFLAKNEMSWKVFAKSEGLKLNKVPIDNKEDQPPAIIFMAIIGVIASLLSSFLNREANLLIEVSSNFVKALRSLLVKKEK